VIVDGKPLREAIHTIAAQTQINVWFDRRVDPSVAVALGPLGPTPFVAFQRLAESSGCVVMPIENVLLIGRPAWVDQISAALMSMELEDGPPADVAWDDLTTPSEALRKAVGGDFQLEEDLPHDLWPAVQWHAIDRRVAVALILGQFDRRPVSTESIERLGSEAATDRGLFDLRYSFASLNGDVQKAFQEVAPRGRAVIHGTSVTTTGKVSAHRATLNSVLASVRPKSVDLDRSTFTIKRLRTSAKNAFEQLAQMSGRTCRIESAASEACERMVSVQGTDLTLRELIRLVAAEVGVDATWMVDTIVISAPK
jgi:hypothetical protein